jgi:predicted methyltransferase
MLVLSLRRVRHAALALALVAAATAAAPAARADRYADAVAQAGRPAADLKRDEIDHPAEVLRLAGIRPGMVVADFLAGDGYYSELLRGYPPARSTRSSSARCITVAEDRSRRGAHRDRPRCQAGRHAAARRSLGEAGHGKCGCGQTAPHRRGLRAA